MCTQVYGKTRWKVENFLTWLQPHPQSYPVLILAVVGINIEYLTSALEIQREFMRVS